MVVKKKSSEQNKKEIEKLKKKLKALTVKYLKEKKKRIKNPKDFKKIQEDIRTKVSQANSQQDLAKLIALMGRGSQPLTPATAGTISSRLHTQNLINKKNEKKREDLADTYREIKVDFGNLKDKYNNNTIQLEDIKSLYSKTKGFANDIQQELPSLTSIIGMYQSAKKTYDYIRRFLNNNRPAQENPINLDDPPSPSPPNPPSDPPSDPPLQSQPEIQSSGRGEPMQFPEPPEMPRIIQGNLALLNMYNDLIGNYVNPSTLAMGALAGGGLLGRMRQRIAGRENENRIIEQDAQNIANVAGNLAGAVAERGLGRVVENLDTTVALENRFKENQQVIDRANRAIERIREAREARQAIDSENQIGSDLNRQRASSFRVREAEREARQNLGESQRQDSFRRSNIDFDPTGERREKVIGGMEQIQLEDRLDRLSTPPQEMRRRDIEQSRFEDAEEMRQRRGQGTEYFQEEDPQME